MAKLLETSGWVTAGRNSLYNGDCIIVAEPEAPVSFGSYCAIGRNLTVMPVNHDTRFASIQGTFYLEMFGQSHPGAIGAPSRSRSKGGVKIGSDVWIADNVTILGGVEIGNGACIGAGSIVTKSIPAYHIAAGVPCSTIRPRFLPEVIALLLDIEWWDWPEDKIRRNQEFFFLDLSTSSVERIASSIID